MTDTKRIKECRRKIISALNEAKIPYAVSELILENVLSAVRENMAAEEATFQRKENAPCPSADVAAPGSQMDRSQE